MHHWLLSDLVGCDKILLLHRSSLQWFNLFMFVTIYLQIYYNIKFQSN